MGLFHRATITPSKAEVVTGWVADQPWGPGADEALEVVGAFRFDDPEGEVGIETHLVEAASGLYQVPVTYRSAPRADDDAGAALITTIEHSALGTRWVYDGLRDPVYVVMVTAVAMTGQGEALGMVNVEGRWVIAPANVRIQGGGWDLTRTAVDGLQPDESAPDDVPRFANDELELRIHRRPPVAPSPRPSMALTAQLADGRPSVLLARVAASSG